MTQVPRDAWIYAKPSAWVAIAPAEEAPVESWHLIYSDAKTGHWETFPGGFEVYNTVGSDEQLQSIIDALEAAEPGSVARIFFWQQGPGVDSLDKNPTIPADVLAVMRPHITYDAEGTPIGSEPATYDRPNWGHVIAGQKTRIFAGGFSKGFSAGFR